MTSSIPKAPFASIPYAQHHIVNCPPSSFSQIKNTNSCQNLCSNISQYVSAYLDCRITKEAQYWCTMPKAFSTSDFTQLPGSQGYRFFTADEWLCEHIKFTGSFSGGIGFIIPPTAVALCTAASKCLGRPIKSCDTFHFTIANCSDSTVFLATCTNNGGWSPYNSSNGWLPRIIFPGQSTTFWIRFNSCQQGQESYDIIRPTITCPIFDCLPGAPAPSSIFPEYATFTTDVAVLVAAITLPPDCQFDFGTTDPSSGIPP